MVRIGVPLRYNHLSDGRCILYLAERLRRTLQKAGSIVIPIAPVQDVDYCDTKYNEYPELTDKEKSMIEDTLDLVDGIVFPGGHKITPYDAYLLERCVERNIPTLGICLGMQLMSCYKETFKVYPNETELNHYQESDEELTHKVSLEKNSKLYKIIGKEEILVNSFHRFHASENPFYIISAHSEDGYIEGIEIPTCRFHIGIQWHPEISYEFDENSRRIIDSFIKECGEKK